MTREELKEHCLKQIESCEMWAKFHGEEPHGKVYEEHKLILELLEQESCDAISRQAVLDGLGSIAKVKAKSDAQKSLMGRVMFFVEQLPPVTPQPKTGHWFIDERPESDRETICSNCEQPIFKYHKLDFDYRPKYCHNCGTKMVEPQESEG